LLCPLAIAGCGDIPALQPPVFEMTLLNKDGSENDGKDFAANPWACVLDKKSGLVWEVKRTGAGLHSIDNTYTWYDPDPNSNGGFAGKANGGTCGGSDCDTLAFAKAVNEEKLCGLSDWHMPSRFELGTIADESVSFTGPMLPKAYFPEFREGKYWTDTTFRTRRAAANAWSFGLGAEFVAEKSESLHAILVHIAPKPAEPAKQPSGK
jgi:hypothetical protein